MDLQQFERWACLFSGALPRADRTLEKERFLECLVENLFILKDVFAAIRALLGSDAVGQMLRPTLLPRGLSLCFLFPWLFHV
ncbi:hypothetical protein [uncultured Desulfobulbus sp.]|uniref:hypothetical protein n=1 Tax=uncultured Desulfobulbus sp. TaxID=239745 RepID=UPI0029C8E8FC|nr:hypothetical protein [uncultured Desulfobulbus sp.]